MLDCSKGHVMQVDRSFFGPATEGKPRVRFSRAVGLPGAGWTDCVGATCARHQTFTLGSGECLGPRARESQSLGLCMNSLVLV